MNTGHIDEKSRRNSKHKSTDFHLSQLSIYKFHEIGLSKFLKTKIFSERICERKGTFYEISWKL